MLGEQFRPGDVLASQSLRRGSRWSRRQPPLLQRQGNTADLPPWQRRLPVFAGMHHFLLRLLGTCGAQVVTASLGTNGQTRSRVRVRARFTFRSPLHQHPCPLPADNILDQLSALPVDIHSETPVCSLSRLRLPARAGKQRESAEMEGRRTRSGSHHLPKQIREQRRFAWVFSYSPIYQRPRSSSRVAARP